VGGTSGRSPNLEGTKGQKVKLGDSQCGDRTGSIRKDGALRGRKARPTNHLKKIHTFLEGAFQTIGGNVGPKMKGERSRRSSRTGG